MSQAHPTNRRNNRPAQPLPPGCDEAPQPRLEPGTKAYPQIVAVRTEAPPGYPDCVIPFALYRDLDPINLAAASLYRVVVVAALDGTRMLDVRKDVIRRLAMFHNWSTTDDAIEAIGVAADLLERCGWILRERLPDGAERWTPLGRDRPRLEPREPARCGAQTGG